MSKLSSPLLSRELLHESILVFRITSVSQVPGTMPDIILELNIQASKEWKAKECMKNGRRSNAAQNTVLHFWSFR